MKKRYSKKLKERARRLYINGKSQREIAKIINIRWQYVWDLIKDIPMNKRKKLPAFGLQLQIPSSSKRMSKAKARILAYLVSDGYVDMKMQKNTHKYMGVKGMTYRKSKSRKVKIAFYNNCPILLNKFTTDFKKVYGITPIYSGKRRELMVGSTKVYEDLIRYCKFGSRQWIIPTEIKHGSDDIKREWLKAFCDAEGHVENYKRDKRVIISSINKKGLISMKKLLNSFKIDCYINGPYKNCYRLKISKKHNLLNFKQNIGFNHPEKQNKLNFIINYFKIHTKLS